MFDKVKFAQILKNINDTYDSQRDFSKKSEINRTYLSQYMNMKIDEPPKPKTLEKLVSASRGLTDYHELMEVCGYIEDEYFIKLNKLNEKQDDMQSYYIDRIISSKLSVNEEITYNELLDIIPVYKLSYFSDAQIEKELNSYFNNMDYLNDKSKIKIKDKLKLFIKYYSEMHKINEDKANLKVKYKSSHIKKNSSNPFLNKFINNEMCNIPIFGKIAAGEPIFAEQHIEGYLPVDPNVYGLSTSDDLFYLIVSGQSMNLKIKNGDYALIKKQDYAEDGDIVVAIVNGDDEATLKKYRRLNDQFVLLEPMSTDSTIEAITVDLKNTNFKIIGKAIGYFGKF